MIVIVVAAMMVVTVGDVMDDTECVRRYVIAKRRAFEPIIYISPSRIITNSTTS